MAPSLGSADVLDPHLPSLLPTRSRRVDRLEFETATADILALESNELVNKLNAEKQQDLRTLCVQVS